MDVHLSGMKNPTLISGLQTEGPYQYAYVGLELGRYQYRIYEDREGWFINGEYTAIPPKGASVTRIKTALDRASSSFLEYLAGRMEKWKLKEQAGI